MSALVWIFRPDRDGGRSKPPIRAVQDACRERGWPVEVRRTTGRDGRALIRPEDARKLYRDMHRARVAVLSIQGPGAPGPQLMTRPPQRSRPLRWKEAYSLRLLCRHKAFFRRVRWDRSSRSWVPLFAQWLDGEQCDGPSDCRCLPLHVFSCERGWSRRLLETNGRRGFDAKYGPGSRRVDRQKRAWEHATEHHGHETLQVSGFELPRGFHWDVQAEEVELWTPNEGWRIRRYVNVFPDAGVIGREPYAKRLFPTKTKAP